MRTIKKIFLLLSYIAVNNIVQAQAPHLPGSFISHPELAKFTGDWKWGSGTDSVLLHLEKQFIHYPMPLSYDEEAIVGWHKYMKNGIMIESSLQYSGWPYKGGHASILAGSESPVTVNGSFREHTKSKACDLYLTMIDSTYSQMDWKLYEAGDLTPDGFIKGFTLPVNIVLNKVKLYY